MTTIAHKLPLTLANQLMHASSAKRLSYSIIRLRLQARDRWTRPDAVWGLHRRSRIRIKRSASITTSLASVGSS
jgi:hypothetical protein